MSELKPIKAGCMAVVSKGTQAGKFLSVQQYIGSITDFKGEDYWKVDELLDFIDPMGPDLKRDFWPESMMMRIDDPDLKEEPKNVDISLLPFDLLTENQVKELISDIKESIK